MAERVQPLVFVLGMVVSGLVVGVCGKSRVWSIVGPVLRCWWRELVHHRRSSSDHLRIILGIIPCS